MEITLYTKNEIMTLLEGRRTYRRFDETRQIPDEVITDMKNAARLASCGMNRQSLRYIFVRTPELVNAVFDITKWGAALPDGQGTLIRNITLFAVLIYELFGPLFTRMALQAAGDIKPMSDDVKHRRKMKLEAVGKDK